MKYLLDTCVTSELVAKHPNPKVVDFIDSLDSDDVFLSVITIGEIAKGIEELSKSKRKQELHVTEFGALCGCRIDYMIEADKPEGAVSWFEMWGAGIPR
jgi:hypothetical protein